MKTARQRTIKASPAATWRAISPLESVPQWLSGVESVEHTGGPTEGVGRRQRVTKLLYAHDVEIDQEVVAWEPEKVLAIRHIRESSDGRELSAVRDFRTTVTLTPQSDGTLVHVEYYWSARLGRPWLFSLIFGGRVMSRELRETLEKIEGLATADL